MVSLGEVLTAVGASLSVVALSVGATIYLTQDSSDNVSSQTPDNLPITVASVVHRYGIGDAYFPCRDLIQENINSPGAIRNINVDTHSSRYDDLRNDNVVFINLEIAENEGPQVLNQRVTCRVSAASNEVTSFQLRKN